MNFSKTQTLIIDEIPFCNCNEGELTETKNILFISLG